MAVPFAWGSNRPNMPSAAFLRKWKAACPDAPWGTCTLPKSTTLTAKRTPLAALRTGINNLARA